jgi:glycosyltransferase involved in cell wall biosynthesis
MSERLTKLPTVLLVGPSIEKTPGGMAEVLRSIINSPYLRERFRILYISTHEEGSKLRKTSVFLKAIINFLRRLPKANIIHLHAAEGASFLRKSSLLFLSKLMGKRTILHLHPAYFSQFVSSIPAFFKRGFVLTLEKSDIVFVLSLEWKRELEKFSNNINLKVFYNWVKIPQENEVVKRKQVLFLGRIGERKGTYVLVDAIPEVIKDYPECQFVFAGDGEIENLKKLVEEKGINSNVKIIGWVKGREKERVLSESLIFVLPSFAEGLPVAILEAMAHRLPIIATPVGAIPEVIEEGENGILVEPGDNFALSQAIKKLLADEKLRERMGRNNVEKIRREFAIERRMKELGFIYDSLLKRRVELG